MEMKKNAKKAQKRLSIGVPSTTNDYIEALADDWNVSKTLAAKKLLEIGIMIEAYARRGGEVKYHHIDGASETIYRKEINKADLSEEILGMKNGSLVLESTQDGASREDLKVIDGHSKRHDDKESA